MCLIATDASPCKPQPATLQLAVAMKKDAMRNPCMLAPIACNEFRPKIGTMVTVWPRKNTGESPPVAKTHACAETDMNGHYCTRNHSKTLQVQRASEEGYKSTTPKNDCRLVAPNATDIWTENISFKKIEWNDPNRAQPACYAQGIPMTRGPTSFCKFSPICAPYAWANTMGKMVAELLLSCC